MRGFVAFMIVVVMLGVVGVLTRFVLGYQTFLTVVAIGAATGVVAGLGAAFVGADRSRSDFKMSLVMYGVASMILGAVAAAIPFGFGHETVGVVNGLATPITISSDGHVLEANLPAGYTRTYKIPTTAKELTASVSGAIVDRVSLANASIDEGLLVYDVGGKRCFATVSLQYGGISFGPASEPSPLRLGERRVFRADVDYLFASPETVSSKSSTEHRTVLIARPCEHPVQPLER